MTLALFRIAKKTLRALHTVASKLQVLPAVKVGSWGFHDTGLILNDSFSPALLVLSVGSHSLTQCCRKQPWDCHCPTAAQTNHT